jgi:hypothetical protein
MTVDIKNIGNNLHVDPNVGKSDLHTDKVRNQLKFV